MPQTFPLQIAVFIFYCCLFSFLVTRIGFFRKSGLSKWTLVGILLLKVAAGLGYAYFYSLPAYRPNSDTFRFFDYSLQETDWLVKNPLAFFRDIFSHGYQETGNVFIGENSYWNDLKSNVIIKLLAICNVFTRKNYYADIVFFNFLFLFGIVAFYRLLHELFPQKKWLLIISIVCMPSFLFWCSGIHKDGLLFSVLGLVFWLFHQSLKNGFTVKRIIGLAFCFAAVFVLRNYVCLALVPAFIGWYFSDRYKNPFKAFAIVYAVSIVAFFSTALFPAKFNLLNYFSIKQAEFMQLSGGSSVSLNKLEPTATGFIRYFPSALDMALLRPHVTEMKNKSYLPAIAEVMLFFLLIALCFFFKVKSGKVPPTIWACWLFAITILLVAGYTITFSGAIVRYRGLVLPFIMVPLICWLKVPLKGKNETIDTN